MANRTRLVCVALLLLFLFSSCAPVASSGTAVSGDSLQQAVPGGQTGSDGAEIALFITEEQKNHGLGQAVWNAVSRFSGEEGVTNGAYTVNAGDIEASLATIDLAVKSAAGVLVAIGDEMAGVVERAQVLYPELQFILLGVEGETTLHGNAVRLEYDELQAGWLAGYAAVLEGYRVLAFVETAPAMPDNDEEGEGHAADELAASDDGGITRQRNLGFVLGADAAAGDLGLEADSVQIQTLEIQDGENATQRRETIAGLYESGVELLFAGDGAVQNDALRVARGLDAGMIGISLRFAHDDAASVASVERAPGQPLYSLLRAWKNGSFPTERVFYSGLEQEAFSLESNGFARFTSTQYGTLVARFAGGTYAQALHAKATTGQGRYIAPLELSTQYVLLVESQIDEGTGMFLPPAYYGGQEEQDEGGEEDGGSQGSSSAADEADSSEAENDGDAADSSGQDGSGDSSAEEPSTGEESSSGEGDGDEDPHEPQSGYSSESE